MPDFQEAGLELKTFPIKHLKDKRLVAKERVSLGMIDYGTMATEEWAHSSFLKKNSFLLLLAYLYQKGITDYFDYIFNLAELWRFSEEDLKIMKDDWLKIREKVKAGKAHEISEGDTLYLGAVTKSATGNSRTSQPFNRIPAKPRALCLKQQYMNLVVDKILGLRKLDVENAVKSVESYEKGETFEEFIIRKFKPYFGMSLEKLGTMFAVGSSAKNFAATITRRILGVRKNKIEEFEKAGITTKTIRLDIHGNPEEAISFPRMHFKELALEDWDDSTLREMLAKRFFLVIYQKQKNGTYKLAKVKFWSMPEEVLDDKVRKVWESTKKSIVKGDFSKLVKSSDDMVSHVRPHGRNSKDKDILPNGKRETKRCFWLNRDFIRDSML